MAETENQVPQEPENQEEVKKLKDEIDAANEKLRGVVDELKEERKKRAEAEANAIPPKPVDEVESKVREVLEEERRKSASQNREVALRKFQDENKEFHPDNDSGGLKLAALTREFDGLKTDGLNSIEQFFSAYEKAQKLISSQPSDETTVIPNASTPTPPTTPRTRVESKLSAREQQVISELGWTEERYLKVKQSQPKFVEKLLT